MVGSYEEIEDPITRQYLRHGQMVLYQKDVDAAMQKRIAHREPGFIPPDQISIGSYVELRKFFEDIDKKIKPEY